MVRFMPEIEKYRQYGLYQMVLTIPNVNGYELQESIERLLKAFKQLTRYFTGNIKIKGLDIAKWGYKGAIRSLEITYQGNEYHPHLHVLLCMTDDLGKKYIKNDYSYDRNKIRENRLFSEKEILIQKIFCLLVNGIEVNKINLKNRKIGYSCMIEKFNDDDYVEVFKYLVKGDELDPGSNEKLIMSYDNFKVLYDSLMNVRQLQGYGCFYNIKDCEISELADETYYAVINELKLKESPEVVLEKPQELVDDKEYLIISKKRIYSYLKLYHEKM
jgi:hypothetical protein